MMLLGFAFAVKASQDLSPIRQDFESTWLCGQASGSIRWPAREECSNMPMRAKAVGGPKRKDTKKQAQVQKERKKKDDVIELEGNVVAHSHNNFKVLLTNGAEVQCTLAGKLRMNNIKVMEGDAVTVEMSPFDLTRGRIVFRTIKMPGE